MNVPAKMPEGDVMESVIAKGDLAKLTPDERVRYYTAVCKSLGLNALTQPLSYITLNGKLTLYATRACTDQLRKLHNVSLEVVSRQLADDILTIRVKAHTPDGRVDEDLGAVPFPPSLKGEACANAVLKAVTKAKRRVTLSICGLGWLDETEIEDIPATAKSLPHDPQTGEITESRASPAGEKPHPLANDDVEGGDGEQGVADTVRSVDHDPAAVISIEVMAKQAAMRGEDVFNDFYKQRTREEKVLINTIGAELRKQMKLTEAYRHGQQAKADGHLRKSIPPEYRDGNGKVTREALCWQAGFDGQAMPEFGD